MIEHPSHFQSISLGIYGDLENICMPCLVRAIQGTLDIGEETLELDVDFAFWERM